MPIHVLEIPKWHQNLWVYSSFESNQNILFDIHIVHQVDIRQSKIAHLIQSDCAQFACIRLIIKTTTKKGYDKRKCKCKCYDVYIVRYGMFGLVLTQANSNHKISRELFQVNVLVACMVRIQFCLLFIALYFLQLLNHLIENFKCRKNDNTYK